MSLTISWSCVGHCSGQSRHQTNLNCPRCDWNQLQRQEKVCPWSATHQPLSPVASESVHWRLHALLSTWWLTWCPSTWQKGVCFSCTTSYLPSQHFWISHYSQTVENQHIFVLGPTTAKRFTQASPQREQGWCKMCPYTVCSPPSSTGSNRSFFTKKQLRLWTVVDTLLPLYTKKNR